MIYIRDFETISEANTVCGGGVESPHTDLIEETGTVNFMSVSTDTFTCSFGSDGVADEVEEVSEGPANNEIWYTSSDGNVVTPYDTPGFGANIVSNTYSGGKGIITFDGNVTSIGDSAFAGCTSLSSITIPGSVTSIGDRAFSRDTNLNNNLSLPTSIISIYNTSMNFLGGGTNKFNYEGTISQWNAITKHEVVSGTSPHYTITCIDGTVSWTPSCFPYGTLITLSDGTKKKVEELTYDDTLRVWNADEGKIDSASIIWLTSLGLMNDHYYKLTFSDGTILKVTGQNSNHKMYNVDTRKFEGCAYAEIGDRIYSENGIVTLTNKEYIEETVEYVNVITDQHINCFAEGILTSDRYGNTYPHDENMKYIKDSRTIRPYSEFEAVGISQYWYDHLRLGEQTESLEETQKYIAKLEGQMRNLPENQ